MTAATSADASHAMRCAISRAERVAGDEDAVVIDRILRLEVVDDRGQVLDVEVRVLRRVRIPRVARVQRIGIGRDEEDALVGGELREAEIPSESVGADVAEAGEHDRGAATSGVACTPAGTVTIVGPLGEELRLGRRHHVGRADVGAAAARRAAERERRSHGRDRDLPPPAHAAM